MSQFYNDSIFWIELDKIKPNPFQPRKEFDPIQLQALADSIKQYGVLQALVVTRNEFTKPDGGIGVEYELIAGERRLRASKLAGLREVPVLIKTGDESSLMKLELAIIENVQREDLNAVDRAHAFERLVNEFGFKHAQIAEKVGKSREYVTEQPASPCSSRRDTDCAFARHDFRRTCPSARHVERSQRRAGHPSQGNTA